MLTLSALSFHPLQVAGGGNWLSSLIAGPRTEQPVAPSSRDPSRDQSPEHGAVQVRSHSPPPPLSLGGLLSRDAQCAHQLDDGCRSQDL